MKREEFLQKLNKAISAFIKTDGDLLKNKVNERTISAKLMVYLLQEFPNYHVDCEYNRLADGIKRLPSPENSSSNNITGKTIFPDILIHKRRDDSHNLAIIELKKADNTDTDRDIEKLKALTGSEPYLYRFGVHLTFCPDCSYSLEHYVNGTKVIKDNP